MLSMLVVFTIGIAMLVISNEDLSATGIVGRIFSYSGIVGIGVAVFKMPYEVVDGFLLSIWECLKRQLGRLFGA